MMTRLPPKRLRPRSGIERAPKREWPRHRAFLRRHQCAVPGCLGTQIEVSHLRSAANAGTGLKPHDAFAVPMCAECHRYYHNIGHKAFERINMVDLFAMAATFVKQSPDKAMKESLALVEV